MNPVLGHSPFVYNPYGAPPALPVGWIENYTPTGQPYWFNTLTNQSSWVFPMIPAPKKKQIKKKIPGTHWLFVLTHDGYEFYYDRETKTSVWEMPEELKEPMEELKRLEIKEKEDKQHQQQQQEEESKKRALLEQEEQEEQEAKRVKLEQEEALVNKQKQEVALEHDNTTLNEEATEMTEEDIMWQLQQMEDQESDIEEDEEQQQQQQQQHEENVISVVEKEQVKQDKIPELSDQERIDKFNELLKESNISPFAVYSVEQPKLMTDPRFSLVPHNKQKGLFNKYCHELGEQIRIEKAKEIKKPEDEFKELLESKVTSKMYWDDFRRKFKDDPRFKALSVTRQREALFKEHVKHNLNKKKNPIEEYNNLLRNTREIHRNTRWRDAKKILENHDAYYAIDDKEKREDLFRDYLEQL